MSIANSNALCSPEEYRASIEALIAEEDNLRRTHQNGCNSKGNSVHRFAEASLNAPEYERRAAQIVEKLRRKEGGDGNHQFLKHIHHINDSKLFKIARRMPKGGHLHIHFNTCLPPSYFVEKARTIETLYVRTDRPLIAAKDFEEAEVTFKILPHAQNQKAPVEIFDNGCLWIKWSCFREKFPSCAGKDPEKWVEDKILISSDEAYAPDQTLMGIWARFNRGTRCIKGLFSYESIFRSYIGAAIESLIADGVMYAEMRPNFFDKFIVSDDGQEKLYHHDWLRIIREEIAKKRAELEREGRLEQFPFGFKVVYCAPRSIPMKDMEWCLADCIELKEAFPELICGFDLVGQEDLGNPIRTYLEPLLNFRHECESRNIDIPFMLHAGETNIDRGGTDDPGMSNLYDAVLLGSKRIGHGYALPKHPLLLQLVREKDICVELCPVSNEVLGLCRSVKEHTFPALLRSGVKCCVNSDNPAWFSSNLSYDFWQTMVGDPEMTLHGWRVMAEWSLEYSCLGQEERSSALRTLRREWEGFCRWVVEEFGGL